MSWDVSGSGLGTFSDGFGVILEKGWTGSTNENSQKWPGVFFRGRGIKNTSF